MAYLRLYLLGPPRLEQDSKPLVVHRRRAMALLGYLAVTGGPHSRDTLATLFWPEDDQRQARGNLRRTLSVLVQTVGKAWLEIERETIYLAPAEDFWLDVANFQQNLAANQAHHHLTDEVCSACLDRLSQAVVLYRDDFMAGFSLPGAPDFDEWQFFQAEKLRRELAGALERLAQAHAGRNELEAALAYAQRRLALDPLDEAAHRNLMLLHVQSGQPASALRQYQLCLEALQTELGLSPAPETRALYERIRIGDLSQDKLLPAPLHLPTLVSLHSHTPSPPHLDWGEAPDITTFYGREAEVKQLTHWLIEERCRLVGVLGMGGIGKTALATHLADQLQAQFAYVIWRSLRNAPPLEEVLEEWLRFLSDQQVQALPPETDKRLSRLLDYLRQKRCLLILDNVEIILHEVEAGHYRPGYEGYGQLFQRLGESRHQSCLLLTSREKPAEFVRLEGNTAPVRSLQLPYLSLEAGRVLLQDKGLKGPEGAWQALVERFSGNPLALKIVAETIRELFRGDIEAFLAGNTAIFGGIWALLAEQFNRLSALEQELMIWLAIEREAIGPETLQANLVQTPLQRELLEQLRALRRRSLLERGETGFTLQNVVMEYVTGWLVERVSQEMVDGEVTGHLNRFALLKAQAKEYVRASQARLILQPIVERLGNHYGTEGVEARLKELVVKLRQAQSSQTSEVSETSEVSVPQRGYAGGNLLNLLLHLKPEVRGLDFSGLALWQAYLQGMKLQEVNFSRTNLVGSVFTDIFGVVSAVAFSPDGQLLAAGTGDSRIWVWRVADGQLLLTFKGHTNWISSICFSPDGHRLASGSLGDQIIRLWDTTTGQCLNILEGHTDKIRSVCFSPDGQRLASGSNDQTIRLWDANTGQCLNILEGHTGVTRSVCFSPDGQNLASGSFDDTIRLWNIQTGQCLRVLEGHTNDVESVSFSPDGQSLASGSVDRTIRLWDIQTGQCYKILEGHTSIVRAAYFSPDGQGLISGSHDQTIRLWNTNTGQCLRALSGHSHWVETLSLSPDGQTIASGSHDQTIRLWEASTGQCLRILQGHTNWIISVIFSPDGQRLASGGTDQTIRLWDTDTSQILKILQGHQGWVWSICFSPDGQMLASSGQDQTVRLWDVHTGQSLKVFQGQMCTSASICFSPDGQILAGGSNDWTIHLWDVHTGHCLRTLQGHTHAVNSVCFSPDGQLLASGGQDQTIRLWDVASGHLLRILQGHRSWLWSVCFSPNGQTLASSSDDRTIRLWEVDSGQCLKILQEHTDSILSACFSPNGQKLASGSDDQTIRLWEVDTGQCLQILPAQAGGVGSVHFSPDGQILASSHDDESIRLWEVKSGTCLKILRAERPYERLNITGAIGLSEAQKASLKALGAYEE